MSTRVRYQKEGREGGKKEGRRREGRATDRIVDWGIILRRLSNGRTRTERGKERIGVKKVAGGAEARSTEGTREQ